MLLTLCSSLSLVAFLWFSEFFFCNSNYHGNIITFSSNNPIKLWPQLNKRNPKRIMKMSTPNFIYPYFFLIKVILLMFYIFIMFSFAILFILPSICFISNHFFYLLSCMIKICNVMCSWAFGCCKIACPETCKLYCTQHFFRWLRHILCCLVCYFFYLAAKNID